MALSATLDRDTVTLGESATLTVSCSGGSPDQPTAPAVAGLEIVSVGQSSQFSFVNGQMTSTVSYNYSITPRKAGDFTIPGFTAMVGNSRLSSQPVKLKVVAPGAPAPDTVNSGNQLAFLRLQFPKKEVYVGELIPVQLQLYLRQDVQNVSQFQPVAFPADGFSVSGGPHEGQHRRTQIGNVGYSVIDLTLVMRAVRSGPTTAGPYTANVVLDLPSNDRRRDPMFDVFGFGSVDRQRVALASDSQTIQVLPLPTDGKPADFNGAVGNFSMNVSAGPTNLAAGDPITVRVAISGHGPLDAVNLPDQNWHEFKTYAPTSKTQPSDQLGLSGTKTFEQIVVPQNAEIKELPPITFSFFDPDLKKYRTLTHPAVPLVVRSGGALPSPSIALGNNPPAQQTPALSQDIVHIKEHLGMITPVTPPWLEEPWFLGLQAVPLLAWLGALGWRKRHENLANNPRLRRRRKVAQIIQQGLAKLRHLAQERKSDEFFAELTHLLQERLGERLDLPASAITEAVIDERLRPRGMSDDVLQPLQELFQASNVAKYAPVKTTQELSALIPKLESVLSKLEALD